MNALHYIGFDVHKKTIRFCVKTAAGEIAEEGVVAAQRDGPASIIFRNRAHTSLACRRSNRLDHHPVYLS